MNFQKSKLVQNLEDAIFDCSKNICGNLFIHFCYSKIPSWVNQYTAPSFKTYKELEKMNCSFVIKTNNKTKVYKTLKGVMNEIKKQ